MSRLKDHNKDKNKNWWEDTFIILSEDFNKNTQLFFENQFINQDEWIDPLCWSIENKNSGQNNNKENNNHYDQNVNKNFEYVIEKFMHLFRNEFYIGKEIKLKPNFEEGKEFEYKYKNYNGKIFINDNGMFVLKAGAKINPDLSLYLTETYRNTIINIINDEDQCKKNDDGSFETTKDLKRKYPSFFAELISGKSRNGWTCFKNKNGKTLDDVYRSNL